MGVVALVVSSCLAPIGVFGTRAPTMRAVAPANAVASDVNDCDSLRQALVFRHRERNVSFACNVAARGLASSSFALRGSTASAAITDSGAPTCSPVCTTAMDVVVVLGSSEKPLTQADAAWLQRMSGALLKHFDLNREHGSLFGLIDISGGLQASRIVSPLSSDRSGLESALVSWHPSVGAPAVPSSQLQGIEHRPDMLSMLKNARAEVRRTLIVLTLPSVRGLAQSSMAAASKTPGYFPIFLGANVSSYGAQGDLEFDAEVMEFLSSICPAVTIDPSMPCGRMRWGHAEVPATTSPRPSTPITKKQSNSLRPYGGPV